MVKDTMPKISAIDKLPFYTEQHSRSELECITYPSMTPNERKALDPYLLKQGLEFNTSFADQGTQTGRYQGQKFYVQIDEDVLRVPSLDRTMFFAMTPLDANQRKGIEQAIGKALSELRNQKQIA